MVDPPTWQFSCFEGILNGVQNGEKTPESEPAAANPGTADTPPTPELRKAFVELGRAFGAAARRPHGRLAVMCAVLVLVVATTGIVGAAVVPSARGMTGAPAASEEVPSSPSPEDAPEISPSPLPSPSPSAAPAERFAGWAATVAPKVEIPVIALQAYAYAEWVLSQTRPSCKLQWTTLAAIAKIESDHGRTKGATLDDNARALPPIIGPALDGTGGTRAIADTDGGALDNDKRWDHAVGPMQFIPETWFAFAVDADGDQVADPHDLDDATLAAAYYLCSSGKDLSEVANWRAVVLNYNNVGAYLQKVFDTAHSYGVKSRT